jgi:LysR family hydrogen peroxide-inducible transcriptional activator
MEMHQLRYVVAVAKTQNFSRAAEMCHVSQPTLSQQIQKLEDELSCSLFIRRKRSVTLTPQGEYFLPRAVRILQEVDAARRDAEDAKHLVRGTIRLGILPTIAPFLLPPAIRGYTAKYPGIEIGGREDTTARLVAATLAQEVDFAIVSLPIAKPRLEICELFSEELLAVVPSTHVLAQKPSVKAGDLKDERMILLREEHCLTAQVSQFCERRHLQPSIWFHGTQLDTIFRLIRSGNGISVVPEMAAKQTTSDSLVFLPIRPNPPRRTLVAIWPKLTPPNRAAREFIPFFSKPPISIS